MPEDEPKPPTPVPGDPGKISTEPVVRQPHMPWDSPPPHDGELERRTPPDR
jgi:hypothetical protein